MCRTVNQFIPYRNHLATGAYNRQHFKASHKGFILCDLKYIICTTFTAIIYYIYNWNFPHSLLMVN
jgi:hypothetical protein